MDFTVIKNDFKKLISPFSVPRLVKEGLRNEQMPGVPHTILSTYGCPHRLEPSLRQNTAKTVCSGLGPWEMGNIQQCCWGGPNHFLQRNMSGTQGLSFAEKLACIIAGAALGPVLDPESEPWYAEEPQCCATPAIGAGTCAQGTVFQKAV